MKIPVSGSAAVARHLASKLLSMLTAAAAWMRKVEGSLVVVLLPLMHEVNYDDLAVALRS